MQVKKNSIIYIKWWKDWHHLSNKSKKQDKHIERVHVESKIKKVLKGCVTKMFFIKWLYVESSAEKLYFLIWLWRW